MEEKKLTDEEILKAFEICKNGTALCQECPCFIKDVPCICSSDDDIDTVLDLINRQKTEIERLTEREKFLENAWHTSIEHTETVERGLKASEARNAERQKKVDELERQLQIAKLQGLTEGYLDGVKAERNAQILKPAIVELPKEITQKIKQQAVKNTAKEIFDGLRNLFIENCAYGCDNNQHSGYYDYSIKMGEVVEWIDDFAKERYGVEVE